MMEFQPIFLAGIKMVPRSEILFCYCSGCELQLFWKPMGGMTFRATCCNKIYDALPAAIDLKFYQISTCKADLTNVKLLRIKKNG